MATEDTPTPTRRQVLGAVGAAVGGVVLAGCTSSDNDPEESPTADGPENTGDDTPDNGSTGPDDTGNGDTGSGGDGSDESAGPDDADDGSETGEGGETGSDSDCPDATVHEEYPETAVEVTSPGGTQKGSVTAAIADTSDTRRTGLSETGCLPPDRGMLFVYDESQGLNFWMINMSFGIDIVYLDSDGIITSIHHADAPAEDEDGTEQHHQYPGEGQYVLEVNYGWTSERGVQTGDVVTFDL